MVVLDEDDTTTLDAGRDDVKDGASTTTTEEEEVNGVQVRPEFVVVVVVGSPPRLGATE